MQAPLEIEALIGVAERHPFTIEGVADAGTDLATASGRLHARMSATISRAEVERK